MILLLLTDIIKSCSCANSHSESSNQELFKSVKKSIHEYEDMIKSKERKKVLNSTIENEKLLFNKNIHKDENIIKNSKKKETEYAIKNDDNFSD